jgi:diguanylate cyclase (GGDEF)-like protein/PAS domain S-box-containing protein
MTDKDLHISKPIDEELESLREKIAHIQSFVQQREKDSLLNKQRVPAGEQSERSFNFPEEGPLGMAFIDSSGRVVKANKTFCDYLGYAPQEIAWLEMAAVLESGQSFLQIVRQILDASIRSSKTEDQVLRKSGEQFWGQITVSIPPSEEKNKKHCLVILEDISDRKQSESVLYAEKQLLERLINSSMDGIVAFDRDLFFTIWNPSMEKILGVAARQTLGRHAFSSCPFLKELGEDKNFEAALKGARAVSKDKLFAIPGTDRQGYFEAYYGPIYGDDEQEIIGGLAIFRDVTERIKLEQSKRLSEQRYSELIENAYDIIYTHDLAGRITSINKAAERILGYSRSEAFQMRFQQFIAPEHRAEFRKMLDRQLADHVPDTQELEIIAKTGNRVTLEVSTRVLYRQGKAVGIQGIARDITERKKWEDTLKEANQKLEDWVHELEQRTHEMTLLSEMGDILRACMNTKEVYEVIVNVAQEIFPGQGGALYVIGPLRNIVESVAEWGDTSGLESTFTPNECWALRRGRTHCVDDVQTGLLCKHLHAPMPKGYICVPMMAQSEAVGILHLKHPEDTHISEAKQKLAIAMAENVAMALSNLRLHETLRNQSIRDQLTGLFNRSFMEESLELELRRSVRSQQPLSIMILSMDDFQEYADKYGIIKSDSMLCDVGAMLKSNVRKGDIACRYSGHVYILILPTAGIEVSRKRAENLRELIAASAGSAVKKDEGPITISAGLAVYPEHGQTVEALLRSAESALKRAKSDGGNRVAVAN